MCRTTLFTIAIFGACATASPTEIAQDKPLRLEPGKPEQPVKGLYVTLLKVENDSRCPINARCVWAGDAEVHIGVASDTLDSTLPVVLHTSADPRSAVRRGYLFRLDSLTPHPVAGSDFPATGYRAWLTVRVMPD